jgi:uncharacterized membrane protein
MEFSPLHFFPLPLPFLLIFFLLLGFLIVLVQIGILEYAYEKMGIHRRQVFVLLLLSLLGSYVNIPVAQLPTEKITSVRKFSFSECAHRLHRRRRHFRRDLLDRYHCSSACLTTLRTAVGLEPMLLIVRSHPFV